MHTALCYARGCARHNASVFRDIWCHSIEGLDPDDAHLLTSAGYIGLPHLATFVEESDKHKILHPEEYVGIAAMVFREAPFLADV